ncbi:hypothetical protein [Profundibacter sp.]
MRFGVFALSLLMLGGCLGAPELPLLSDVDLAEDAPESGLAAAKIEASETGLEELQSVEDVPVVAKPEKPRRGLAALFGRRNTPPEDAIAEVDDDTPADKAAVVNAVDGEVADVAPDLADKTPRRGLFGGFGQRNKNSAATAGPVSDVAVASDNAVIDAPTETDENVEVAAVDPEEPVRPRRERGGLLGPRRAKSGQPPQGGPDVVLPFGQIGLACGVRGKALGKEVDRFPERGRGYRLYDTKPSTTGPRTHYITGFKDGCPRQITASLVLLDSPVLHEQLLSVKSSHAQHSTLADKIFQKIKAQVCHIGRGKACPEKRVDEMEKSMAFVTTYERFGGNARWNEILLHNGKVVANSADTQ